MFTAGCCMNGESIALVPTMGALHLGHLALMDHAATMCDNVIASIFVNPTQFGPNEDYSRYPRQEEQDCKLLEQHGVGCVYIPSPEDVYPKGFATSVSVSGITDSLCGASRPGHFTGVATIVTKLLMRVMPDIAVFGEKDYQQLCVIKQLVRDLDIPVRIIGSPTVREPDGLAMSSRNTYLTQEERAIAPGLYTVLKEVAATIRLDETAAEQGKTALLNLGFKEVEYLELCDAETLVPNPSEDRPARLLAAVKLGNVRLIDNVSVE